MTTYTLLAGDKGIVLILVNNDHTSNFQEGQKSFEYAEDIYFILVKKYQELGKINQAIKQLEDFLETYPDSKKCESALFLLGMMYKENKNIEQAKKIWKEYLKKYPEGVYNTVVKTFLEEGD